MPADRIDAVVSLAKRRGFVFPSSEIYGGTRSAWDYGPLGRRAEGERPPAVVEDDGPAARRHRRPRLRGHPGRATSGSPPATSRRSSTR